MGTCKSETSLVVSKCPWASLLFLDNMLDRDQKMPSLLVPCYLTELFYSGHWISQAF